MKKYITLFALLFSMSLSGQVLVDGVNINDLPEIEYCQVLISGKMFSRKLVVNIDYGQEKFGNKNSKVENASGKQRKFNTPMDVLNFMAYNKWDYVDAFSAIVGGDLVYHYLIKKK